MHFKNILNKKIKHPPREKSALERKSHILT